MLRFHGKVGLSIYFTVVLNLGIRVMVGDLGWMEGFTVVNNDFFLSSVVRPEVGFSHLSLCVKDTYFEMFPNAFVHLCKLQAHFYISNPVFSL